MSDNLIAAHVSRMEGYTPGEQPSGDDILKLNTNENPYPPSPAIAEALAAFSPQNLRLYPDPSASALRRKIAEMHGCSIQNIFVGNGSDETLALVTRAFVNDNESVGAFAPTYSLYEVLAGIRNVEYISTPLNEDFSWRQPEPSFKPSLFFLANPNAPTSVAYDKGQITEFCRNFKRVVVIDEAYADFAEYNCADLALRLPNVVVSRTLSKSYSLAGLRLGYAIASRELIDALYKIKDSYNLNAITQTVALAALGDSESMRRNAEKIKNTRRLLTMRLREMGWTVPESQTNFVFARPPEGNAKEIFQHLRDKNIFVRYFDGEQTRQYLRISIGDDQQMVRLLANLR